MIEVVFSNPPEQPQNKNGVLNIISSNIQGVIPEYSPERMWKKYISGDLLNTQRFKERKGEQRDLGKLLAEETRWDILAVQENFFFNSSFRGGLKTLEQHSYRYASKYVRVGSATNIASGIDIFLKSSVVFNKHYEGEDTDKAINSAPWENTSSSLGPLRNDWDYYACKGFEMAEIKTQEEGIIFHFYNLHMDANDEPDDVKARWLQLLQLLEYIEIYSYEMPVIIAGDFNARIEGNAKRDDGELFRKLTDLGFVSSAKNDNYDEKHIVDHIWYRGTAGETTRVSFQNVSSDLSLINVNDLSDHEALRLRLTWTTNE